jgi:hypothetical protein
MVRPADIALPCTVLMKLLALTALPVTGRLNMHRLSRPILENTPSCTLP